MATLPMRSYFLYGTKKNCIHLRAWSKHHHMQFISIWCLVQHLPGTFTFRTMLTATVIHSPILEPTRHQKNHNIQPQSCLVHCASLLMIGRCFTSVKISVHQQLCHQTLFPWHVIQLAINPIGVHLVKVEKSSYSFSATYLLS